MAVRYRIDEIRNSENIAGVELKRARMSAGNLVTYVTGERYPIANHLYDIAVYRTGELFFASWICQYCPKRGQTDEAPDKADAAQAALDAVTAHHASCHSNGAQ